jgi:hypothetical protein
MVAGLVHLVAPTAKIMPLKVFAADGSSRVFDIVRAIYYAVDNGARVINMSFSSLEQSPEITHAIDYATDNGVICVSSAGNSGRALLVYPAALRDVIGVGSITSTDPPARSSFSNYGDSLVRVGAPGEGVITTYPGGGYTAVWGTSFSTALVAGGAALLVQIDSALDEHRASDFLGKADKMPKSGLGRGRLDLYEATRQLPDATQPTIDLVSPASGSTVMNTIVVAASAADNVRVAGVQFLLDNQPLGAEVTTPPYRISWDTTRVKNGTHTLTTIARDASGNAATASVTVVSSNDLAAPTVTMTNPTGGATVSGSVPLTADASDDIEVAGVQFIVDGTPFGAMVTMPPYAIAWSTLAVPNGAHTVTAIARDTAGKETTAVGVTVTVANDKTPPTVALIAPGVGASVSSTVTVAASAADDTALIGVRFLLDGQPLGVEQTTAPYQVAWSTSAVADGAHTITAIARDSAGNETTATAVPVTVANGVVTPP